MAIQRWVVAAGLVGLVAGAGWGVDNLDFDAVIWFPTLNSTVRDTSALATDVVDLRRDLGMQSQNMPEFRFGWQFGRRSRLRVAYTQWGYAGNTILARPFSFSGTPYGLGDRVVSSLDTQYFRLGYEWTAFESRSVDLGLVLELKTLWGDADVNDVTVGAMERQELVAPVPTVGLDVTVKPCQVLDLFADFAGITAGATGYLYELEAGVRAKPVPEFSFLAGYRLFDLKVQDGSDFVKFKLSGPFTSIRWRY